MLRGKKCRFLIQSRAKRVILGVFRVNLGCEGFRRGRGRMFLVKGAKSRCFAAIFAKFLQKVA